MVKKKYYLQRWWITKGWTNIETSIKKDKIMKSFNGWKKQIIDGSFRVRRTGKTIAQRKGSLLKKIERKKK